MHTSSSAKRLLLSGLAFTTSFLAPLSSANACSRAVYLGPENVVVTGRSMDWSTDLPTDLWSFPRGMERNGAAGARSMKWTSKYGSLAASAFDACTADGMNEKGLVANLLYLVESQYPTITAESKRPLMCVSAWTQYVLDNFATVAEAVEALRAEPFDVVTVMTPDGKPGTVHLAISDASGDSAIFEYLGGKLKIHHGREYQVMTNSPAFDQQLALNTYWKGIGGTTFLPGTNRAADRFVRASFYINAVTQTSDVNLAVAATLSVIRNVSVPIGISLEGQPNIATTLWRSVSDQKERRYFFETSRTPNTFWVKIDDLNFEKGQPVLKLDLSKSATYVGNTAKEFKPAKPYAFLEANDFAGK